MSKANRRPLALPSQRAKWRPLLWVLCFLLGGAVPVGAQLFMRGHVIDGLELADGATTQVFALADVNGDGFPDIVTIGFDPEADPAVILLLNDLAGGFDPPRYYLDSEVDDLDDPVAVEVADVGSPSASASFGEVDGNPDVIVLDASAELVIVLWGDGAGGFEFSTDAERFDLIDPLEGFAVGLAAGDFDGQSGYDVAVLDSGGDAGQVLFLCNLPRAPFISCATALLTTGGSGAQAGQEPSAVVIGDFNGNGTTDVAALNTAPGNGNLVLMLGDGQGDFVRAVSPGNPAPLGQADATHLTVGRVDADTSDDVIVVYLDEFAGDRAQVFLGRGSRLSAQSVIESVALGAAAVAAADFNGDHNLDLVVAQRDPERESFVTLGDGQGGFTGVLPSQGLLTGPGIAVQAGDIDGDADDDFIIAREELTGFRVALNQPIQPTGTPTATTSVTRLPDATPTPSPTFATPTPSPTFATPAASATSTSAPFPPDDDDGCNISGQTQSGGGLLPLLAGTILWGVRLHHRHRSATRR